jgi:hypothetical protein
VTFGAVGGALGFGSLSAFKAEAKGLLGPAAVSRRKVPSWEKMKVSRLGMARVCAAPVNRP